MYIYYDFEVFMMDIYKMDLIEFARHILFMYLWTVGYLFADTIDCAAVSFPIYLKILLSNFLLC